jgi:hypothetical protein
MNDLKFEWYYFDIHTDDGYDVIFTLHTKPFNSVFDISIFDVFIYKDNQPLIHHFFIRPQNELSISQNPFCLIVDGDNYIRKSNNLIEVAVKDEKINLSLKFNNLLPEQKPVEMELYPDQEKGKYFKWIVYAPLCDAEGELTWDNNNIKIQGRGYHDYNAGNINLKKRLSGWHWSKFFYGENLLIFGEIVPRKNKTKRVLVHVTPEGCRKDDSPVKIEDGKNLQIKSPVVNFQFSNKEIFNIDAIRFYISQLPAILLPLTKLWEITAHISTKNKFLSILKNILTNVKYIRYRKTGIADQKDLINSFHEEIHF